MDVCNIFLLRITDDYTEEGNAAGGGFALLNIMFESLERFGVNCFQIDNGLFGALKNNSPHFK